MASRSSEKGFGIWGWGFVLTLGASLSAQPADRARTEALERRANDRLLALQHEADRLATQETSLLTSLRTLEVDRQLKAAAVKQADATIAGVQRDLDATGRRAEELSAFEAAERPELRARVIEMYKLGQARYARLLLSAPDLRRLGQASRTVAALAKIDRDKLAEHEHTLAELKTARAALEERKRQAAATRASAERAQAAALRAEQAHNDLIRDIDERRDLTAQLAGELQSAQQKLQTTLRGMPGGTSADAAVLPVRPFRGELDWPLQGDIRRRFGRTATGATSPSNGMEIGAADATTVAAIHEGVVAFAGAFTAFGNLVILDHGSDIFSVYGDLLEVGVAKGARVDRGQAVGSAGPLPGGGTGLYFELRVDGKPVDPLQWLKKKP